MKKCVILAGIILLFAVSAFGQREETEDTTVYIVVVNHEEQYSIWAAAKELPLGWMKVGFKGKKPECLAYIKEVWTDMRPLSLRKKMEAAGLSPPPEPVKPVPDTPKPAEESTAPDKPAPPEEAAEPETVRLFVGNLSAE